MLGNIYLYLSVTEGPATLNTEVAKVKVKKVMMVKKLYFNIVARCIKRFKTAVAMEFAHRDCDWFNLIVLLNI